MRKNYGLVPKKDRIIANPKLVNLGAGNGVYTGPYRTQADRDKKDREDSRKNAAKLAKDALKKIKK